MVFENVYVVKVALNMSEVQLCTKLRSLCFMLFEPQIFMLNVFVEFCVVNKL